MTAMVFHPSQVEKLRQVLWYRYGFRPVEIYGPDAHCRSPGKRPVGNSWEARARQDPPAAVQSRARTNALNTGILCDDGLRAFDIDVEDPAKVKELEELAVFHLGCAPVRYRDNSPRILLLYRAAEGSPPKRSIGKEPIR